MYMHLWEMFAIAIIAGLLWAIVPWEPLTACEAVLAVLSVVALAWGIVAGAVYVIGEVFGR